HARLAREAGAELHYSEPLRTWQAHADGVQVVTDAATYSAEQVVFTCGAWLSHVLGDARVQVRAERATLFWLQPHAPALFELGRFPIYLWETREGGHVYGFPHVGWPGVKVARHHTGDFCDPDTVDR